MENTLLSLSNFKKRTPRFQLGPIDLEIEAGSIVAIVGRNGSGKTTLLNTMMNTLHRDTGQIRLYGQELTEDNITLRQKIAYVPDFAAGHDDLNAAQLAEFVAHWYPNWNQQKFDTLIHRFQIDADTSFGRLSKGTKKALALALSFATEAELLLLDEPTSGLDLFAKRLFIEELTYFMQSEQRSVLLTTHILDDVRRLADYIALMHHGNFLGVYEKDTLINDWKVLWLDRIPEQADHIPGLIHNKDEHPVPFMTRSFQETQQALAQANVNIVQTQAMELDDILAELIGAER